MSIFSALAATVPVLGSLWDPDLAKQRQLEQEEKALMDSANRAATQGDTAAQQQFQARARMTHNQRIRIVPRILPLPPFTSIPQCAHWTLTVRRCAVLPSPIGSGRGAR